MAPSFEYVLQGDIEEKLDEIKRRAAARGVTFRGDANGGTFSGTRFGFKVLDGTYEVFGSRIRVNVTVMPPGYSEQRVDAELRGFIEG